LPKDGTVFFIIYDATSRCQFLSGKFTGNYSLEKTMRLSFLVNSLLPKKGRLVVDTTFSYTYSKRTKQALIWTPRLLALKTIVEEKLEKPTILVC
jgi:hypothetical protein